MYMYIYININVRYVWERSPMNSVTYVYQLGPCAMPGRAT